MRYLLIALGILASAYLGLIAGGFIFNGEPLKGILVELCAVFFIWSPTFWKEIDSE